MSNFSQRCLIFPLRYLIFPTRCQFLPQGAHHFWVICSSPVLQNRDISERWRVAIKKQCWCLMLFRTPWAALGLSLVGLPAGCQPRARNTYMYVCGGKRIYHPYVEHWPEYMSHNVLCVIGTAPRLNCPRVYPFVRKLGFEPVLYCALIPYKPWQALVSTSALQYLFYLYTKGHMRRTFYRREKTERHFGGCGEGGGGWRPP